MATEYPAVVERSGGSNGRESVVAINARYTVNKDGFLVEQPNGGHVFQVFEKDLKEVDCVAEVAAHYRGLGAKVNETIAPGLNQDLNP